MKTIISKNARIDQLVIKAKLNAPKASNMIDKAAELVKSGRVEARRGLPVYYGNATWKRVVYAVGSQSSVDTHLIREIANENPDNVIGLTCDCDYFQKANGSRPTISGQPLCAHIIAASMDDKAAADVEATNAAAWRQMKQASRKAGSGRATIEAQNTHVGYWNSQHGQEHATLIHAAGSPDKFEEMSRRPNNLPQFPEGM